LRRFIQNLEGLKHAELMDVGADEPSYDIFGHPRFFEDPLTVARDSFFEAFAK
jgi:hypothetical protein